jgi:integrase
MTYHFKLRIEPNRNSVLYLKIAHKNARRQKDIWECSKKHFNLETEMITDKHPDYDILAPKILDMKIKVRKLILNGAIDVDNLMNELFSESMDKMKFIDHATKLVQEMKNTSDNFAKINDLRSQNKILGNIKTYNAVINQFKIFAPNCFLDTLESEVLFRFKNHRQSIGNKKSTVQIYLKILQSIYNQGIQKYALVDKNPFKGVCAGLSSKSYNSRKKYISKSDIYILETANVSKKQRFYLDFWLLSFYLGGCDLVDVYYFKKHYIKKNRIFFERIKTSTELLIDLKIHPKAKAIFDKYSGGTDEYLFPFKKDKASYISFGVNYRRHIAAAQSELEIEIKPLGGNLGVKVARHTFANIAKNMLVDTDVIRELMGHERNDIDNYYKDKYPEKMRDEALFKIISSFECVDRSPFIE